MKKKNELSKEDVQQLYTSFQDLRKHIALHFPKSLAQREDKFNEIERDHKIFLTRNAPIPFKDHEVLRDKLFSMVEEILTENGRSTSWMKIVDPEWKPKRRKER